MKKTFKIPFFLLTIMICSSCYGGNFFNDTINWFSKEYTNPIGYITDDKAIETVLKVHKYDPTNKQPGEDVTPITLNDDHQLLIKQSIERSEKTLRRIKDAIWVNDKKKVNYDALEKIREKIINDPIRQALIPPIAIMWVNAFLKDKEQELLNKAFSTPSGSSLNKNNSEKELNKSNGSTSSSGKEKSNGKTDDEKDNSKIDDKKVEKEEIKQNNNGAQVQNVQKPAPKQKNNNILEEFNK